MSIADQHLRSQALEISTSFIVQAPAGSGKTTLLVNRYCEALKTVKHPRQILALTFTQKAREEIAKRVQAQWTQSSSNLPFSEEEVLSGIYTFDALNHYLIPDTHWDERFSGHLPIHPAPQLLYEQAAERCLNMPSLKPAIRTLLKQFRQQWIQLFSLLASLLAVREQWLFLLPMHYQNKLHLPSIAFSQWQTHIRQSAQAHFSHFEVPHFEDRETTKTFVETCLTKKNTWRKRLPPEYAAMREDDEEGRLLGWLTHLGQLPIEDYREPALTSLSALLQLLPPLLAHLHVCMQEAGGLDHNEVALMAQEALSPQQLPGETQMKLDYQYQHILVDEFQDTSLSQWSLLESLSAGFERGDGRSIFLVGDPMQSIYRFRQAQMGLFEYAKHHGLGEITLTPLTLQCNFRSAGQLVESFNQTFSAVFSNHDMDFAPQSPTQPNSKHPFECNSLETAEEEAQAIIHTLKEWQSQGIEDIAILLRSRRSFHGLREYLLEADIPYFAKGMRSAHQEPLLSDLYHLAHFLLEYPDETHLYPLLQSPWIGLPLEALQVGYTLSDYRGYSSKIEILESALSQKAHVLDLGSWIDDTWRALTQHQGTLPDALQVFWDIWYPALRDNWPQWPLIDAQLEQTYFDEGRPDASLQLMTIHAAKGLAFDGVILADLGAGTPVTDSPLLRLHTYFGATGATTLLATHPGARKDDPHYQYLQSREKMELAKERARLLYVGCTRAKLALRCFAHGKISSNSLAHLISPAHLVTPPLSRGQAPPKAGGHR